jgi:hypothetical protein
MFEMPFVRLYATLALGALVLLASLIPAATALAATSATPKPKVAAGFTITKLADAPNGATNCDDLARLDGHLFTGCQNMTQSGGGGGSSTIVEYADDGTVVNTWSLPDKVDGLTGDPLRHRLIVTLNEDAKSHLATLTPSAAPGQQIVNYRYSPDPASPTLTGALHTGGGTDAVSVDSTGHIYTSASYGITKTGTAVFKVALTPPASPGASGTAALSPTWLENATAANGNTGHGSVQLKLNDVDSNAIVPYSSPRYGGSFVIDDQTAFDLVFASNINAGTGLTVLHTPYGLDDIRWATTDGGTLYVVDKGPAKTGASALYKVTGRFVAGTAFASSDSIPDQVDTVNVRNGKLTPFVRNLQTAKGLVYLDAAGSEPSLAVGPPATAAAATPPAGAPSTSSTTATTGAIAAKATTDSDTLSTVLSIAAIVLVLAGGAYAVSRRRPA